LSDYHEHARLRSGDNVTYMKAYTYKIGAICYALWGVIHIAFGGMFLYSLLSGGIPALLKLSEVTNSTISAQDYPGILNGLLMEHSWNLIWFGLFALIVGVAMNWKNSRAGYWMNLVVVGAAELGFIVTIIVPGYFTSAILGPILWILAVIFSTIGIRTMPHSETRTNA